jgi:hypothetical protein
MKLLIMYNSFLHPPIISSLFDSNVLLSTLFSISVSVLPFNERDHNWTANSRTNKNAIQSHSPGSKTNENSML